VRKFAPASGETFTLAAAIEYRSSCIPGEMSNAGSDGKDAGILMHLFYAKVVALVVACEVEL